MRWERHEPSEPCVSPDGHSLLDVMTTLSYVPRSVVCDNCGRAGRVVVFTDDDQPSQKAN